MIPIDKKTIAVAVLALLIGGVAGWYLSGGGHDSSAGAAYQAVVAELDQARRNNNDLTNELHRSAAVLVEANRTIESLGIGLREAQASASATYGLLQQNDSLIAEARRIAQEDQRILRGILEGSQSKNKEP
jgi:methylthioribose-1-phosphate isomerase